VVSNLNNLLTKPKAPCGACANKESSKLAILTKGEDFESLIHTPTNCWLDDLMNQFLLVNSHFCYLYIYIHTYDICLYIQLHMYMYDVAQLVDEILFWKRCWLTHK
jgi:hypothetical protein